MIPQPPAPPRPPTPPFLHRLALPVTPKLWAEARHWTAGEILLPLLTVSLVLGLSLGLYRGWDSRRSLLQVAEEYDARFDPVVVEDGAVRVEGPRLPRWEEGDSSVLVDPDETVPESMLKGSRKLIVRKHEILDTQGTRSTSIPRVMSVLGLERVRIDSASIRAWTSSWGTVLIAGVTVLIVVFSVLGDAITCPLYALVAGWLLLTFRGKALGLTSRETFGVTLAALAVKPLAETVLAILGTSVGFCLGLVVWPAVGTGLGLVALLNLPPAGAPPRAAV